MFGPPAPHVLGPNRTPELRNRREPLQGVDEEVRGVGGEHCGDGQDHRRKTRRQVRLLLQVPKRILVSLVQDDDSTKKSKIENKGAIAT